MLVADVGVGVVGVVVMFGWRTLDLSWRKSWYRFCWYSG
jgi:hypothetical protein